MKNTYRLAKWIGRLVVRTDSTVDLLIHRAAHATQSQIMWQH